MGIDLHRDWLKKPLTLILLVFAVRLVYVLIFHFGFDFNIAEDYYDDIARNLIAGNGYVIFPGALPNLFRYPGYTYFLALLFALSDESYIFIVVVQLLLDIGTLWLLYLIAREIFGQRTAVFAVVIASLYPFTAIYILRYTTEPLFSFILAAAMLFLTRAFVQGGITRFVVAGVLLGAAIWCRASLFYYLLCIPAVFFIVLDSSQKWIRTGAVVGTVVIAVALTVPWGMRNQDITGEFNLLGTAGGYSLWVGNFLPTDGRDIDELSPDLKEVFMLHERRIAGDKAVFSPAGEKRFFKATTDGWIDNPAASAWLIVRKAFRFWFSIYKPRYRNYWAIIFFTQATLLILAVLGVLRGLRERRPQWLIITLVLYFNALHAVTVATFRYSIPVLPYIIMLAAHGMLNLPFLKSLLRPRGNTDQPF